MAGGGDHEEEMAVIVHSPTNSPRPGATVSNGNDGGRSNDGGTKNVSRHPDPRGKSSGGEHKMRSRDEVDLDDDDREVDSDEGDREEDREKEATQQLILTVVVLAIGLVLCLICTGVIAFAIPGGVTRAVSGLVFQIIVLSLCIVLFVKYRRSVVENQRLENDERALVGHSKQQTRDRERASAEEKEEERKAAAAILAARASPSLPPPPPSGGPRAPTAGGSSQRVEKEEEAEEEEKEEQYYVKGFVEDFIERSTKREQNLRSQWDMSLFEHRVDDWTAASSKPGGDMLIYAPCSLVVPFDDTTAPFSVDTTTIEQLTDGNFTKTPIISGGLTTRHLLILESDPTSRFLCSATPLQASQVASVSSCVKILQKSQYANRHLLPCSIFSCWESLWLIQSLPKDVEYTTLGDVMAQYTDEHTKPLKEQKYGHLGLYWALSVLREVILIVCRCLHFHHIAHRNLSIHSILIPLVSLEPDFCPTSTAVAGGRAFGVSLGALENISHCPLEECEILCEGILGGGGAGVGAGGSIGGTLASYGLKGHPKLTSQGMLKDVVSMGRVAQELILPFLEACDPAQTEMVRDQVHRHLNEFVYLCNKFKRKRKARVDLLLLHQLLEFQALIAKPKQFKQGPSDATPPTGSSTTGSKQQDTGSAHGSKTHDTSSTTPNQDTPNLSAPRTNSDPAHTPVVETPKS